MHYAEGGKLYGPDEMEKFCDVHDPRLFENIFHTILNDKKQLPSTNSCNLQCIREVALQHNLRFFRNQVWSSFPTKKPNSKTTDDK